MGRIAVRGGHAADHLGVAARAAADRGAGVVGRGRGRAAEADLARGGCGSDARLPGWARAWLAVQVLAVALGAAWGLLRYLALLEAALL